MLRWGNKLHLRLNSSNQFEGRGEKNQCAGYLLNEEESRGPCAAYRFGVVCKENGK